MSMRGLFSLPYAFAIAFDVGVNFFGGLYLFHSAAVPSFVSVGLLGYGQQAPSAQLPTSRIRACAAVPSGRRTA